MTTKPACLKTQWNGREAYTLSNDLVQMVTLPGGGHIAEFQFLAKTGLPVLNPLWVPPWKSIEPHPISGGKTCGDLRSSRTKGNCCRESPGTTFAWIISAHPPKKKPRKAFRQHGEAPSAQWQKTKLRATAQEVSLTLAVPLPVAGLRFSRELRLRRGESVAYFTETVVNERKADHFFHWTQHVTLAPPFLDHETSRISISATRGRTIAGAYGERSARLLHATFIGPLPRRGTAGALILPSPCRNRGWGCWRPSC